MAQNVVVDLLPQDESLRTLLNACDPSASQTATDTAPSTVPATPQPAAFVLSAVPKDTVEDGAGCLAVDAVGQNILVTDYSVAAVQLNGTTVRLAALAGRDGGIDGTNFSDGDRIGVQIVFTGEPTEAAHELSATPANLMLTVDGSETVVPVSYLCES